MEMYRTMAARAPANDNLAQIFFDAGPKRTLDALEQLLRKAHRAGKLEVPDPRNSAEHFFVLVKGLAHMCALIGCAPLPQGDTTAAHIRSEEHTSELQSLMRISYAVFCLKKKKHTQHINNSSSHA